jgi:serine/threonine protein kinase
MERERWKAVNEIFHEALELPASERKEFVCAASKGDAVVQSDVDRMLEADQKAGSYLESPLLAEEFTGAEPSPAPFQTGDLLKGRFSIVRQVGEGGMGHVFEAFDEELKVRVALKAIRTEIAGNPTALEFFRREVRTARTITHPNVCRTFDLDRGSLGGAAGGRDFVFLTMEFLEGESLSARIKRAGPFDPEEALGLARQIASALDAAHAAGIIHRDIKPANIMLIPSSQPAGGPARAVITDFGLARHDPLRTSIGGSSISHAGPVGTLAYMAPEQLEPGSPVSAATDVYAFGLMLFEMVAGCRAFPSTNLLSGIAQRLAGPPPSLRTLVPELPYVWETVIHGCLRLVPGERFQSAGQVIEALGGAAPPLPPFSRSTLPSLAAPAVHRPRRSWREFAVVAAILLTALSLFLLAYRLYWSEADSKVGAGALVYLTPVQNQSGIKAYDNLTELIRAGLTQSAQINLLDQSVIGDTLQLMTKPPDTVIDESIAREIAMRTGAVRVIFAKVTGSGGSYSLDIDIQQPDASSPSRIREHWHRSFPWVSSGAANSSGAIPQSLLAAIRESSDWIRYKAGESQNDIARLDAAPEDVTTANWQALEDYAQAEQFAQNDRIDNAVTALQSAVTHDPEFALAYARLGDVLLALHRDTEGFRAYGQALDVSRAARLTRREEDRIRGTYAVDTGDDAIAIDAFHDYSVYYKGDYLGWVYPTLPLHRLGRDQEAVEDLHHAIQIAPDRPFALYALAKELTFLGQSDEAASWIDQLRKKGQTDLANEADSYFALAHRRFDVAMQTLEPLLKSSDPRRRSNAYQGLAVIEGELGQNDAALEWLNRGLKEDEGQNNKAHRASKLFARAYIEVRKDAFDLCLTDVRAALQLSRSPRNILAADTVLGTALENAPSGMGLSIRRELEDTDKALPTEQFGTLSQVAKLRTHGEALLANGSSADAVKAFLDASTKDAPIESREFLARALLRLAAAQPDRSKARAYRMQALDAYAATALAPASALYVVSECLPGYYADQLAAYLHLARQLGVTSPEVQHAQEQLASMRGSISSPGSRSAFSTPTPTD